MRLLTRSLIAYAIFVLTAFPFIAKADTIYSALGPGQTFSPTGGVLVGTFNNGGTLLNQAIAQPFTPTQSVTISDAILGLALTVGATKNTPVNVYPESDLGGVPNTILDTLSQVGTITTTPSLVEFTCPSCSILTAGETYWIVAVQSYPPATDLWKPDLVGNGPAAFNETGSATGPWVQNSSALLHAVEINGTSAVTPEPSSLMLLGTGILGSRPSSVSSPFVGKIGSTL